MYGAAKVMCTHAYASTGADIMMGRAPGRGQTCGSDVQKSRFAADLCMLLPACTSHLYELSSHALVISDHNESCLGLPAMPRKP